MNKEKIMKVLPTVLFVTGCVGVFVSEVCAVAGTVKAKDILTKERTVVGPGEDPDEVVLYKHMNDAGFEESQQIVVCDNRKDYILETTKATWKCYIPAAISTTLTLTALIASRRLTARQLTAISALAASSAGLVSRYREVIRDFTDDEQLAEVDREVAKREIEHAKPVTINNPVSSVSAYNEMDLEKDGEVLFFDPFTKMKFKASKLAFLGAKYYTNRNFAIGSAVPLRMFYGFLGIELPEEYKYAGWELSDEWIDSGYSWIDIDAVPSSEPDPETGEKYYIIEYSFEPGDTESSYSFYPAGNPLMYEGSFPE